MLNESENMDELFRKAAEHYPLRVEPEDWEQITTGNLPTPPFVSSPHKRYPFFLLFFLAACLTGYLIFKNNEKAKIIATLTENNSDAASNLEAKKKNAKPSTLNIRNLNGDYKSSTKNLPYNFSFKEKSANKTFSFLNDATLFGNTIKDIHQNNPASSKIISNLEGKTAVHPFAISNSLKRENISEASALKVNSLKYLSATPSRQTSIDKKLTPKNIESFQLNNKESPPNDNPFAEKQENKNLKKFYYGLSSSFNFSTVKSMTTTNPKFGLGVIVGFSFSKSLSIESGITVSSKKYFADGSFFKPKSGTMPANMEVMNLIGTIRTVDIPIVLKYTLPTLENKLFITGGISNAILTSEHNIYDVEMNGQPSKMIADYDKTKFYPAAALNFSLGLQKEFGTKIRGQIEPYIQIPLRGTGIGYMPVTNFGVRAALLKIK